MRTRMTRHKVYGVWEYEQEIADLNKLSEEGWQLEKGGCFHSTFIRNDKVRYLYQLDYAPNLEDRERYLSFFSEQGWEYMNSTYNGWHYFRREYQDNMPYENTEIYTDKESLLEMQGRYYRVLRCFGILYSVLTAVSIVHMIMQQRINILPATVCDALCAVMMWIVVVNIKRRQKGEKELVPIKGQFLVSLLMLVTIIMFFISLL